VVLVLTVTNKNIIKIVYNSEIILNEKMTDLRLEWEKTSLELEKLQINKELYSEQVKYLINFNKPKEIFNNFNYNFTLNKKQFKVAILREEGSNGSKEMAVAFETVGFKVYDITMNDIINNIYFSFKEFSGIVFVGGFSFADVFNAGKAWATIIQSNSRLKKLFFNFSSSIM
jgi:phosphoribosylformylglycinamidine synthase